MTSSLTQSPYIGRGGVEISILQAQLCLAPWLTNDVVMIFASQCFGQESEGMRMKDLAWILWLTSA